MTPNLMDPDYRAAELQAIRRDRAAFRLLCLGAAVWVGVCLLFAKTGRW